MKQRIRLTEGDLHRIVRESVKRVLDEAYSNQQYAHLAGQAHGALNSFGGKLKGFFNPEWKKRKQRQLGTFGDAATDYGRELGLGNSSVTKGGDHNNGSGVASFDRRTGTSDYLANNFNKQGLRKDKNASPYQIQRSHWEKNNDGSFTNLHGNGETWSNQQTKEKGLDYGKRGDLSKSDQFFNVANANADLNRSFRQGQEARKGRTARTIGGTYKNGTGTGSDAFRRLR